MALKFSKGVVNAVASGIGWGDVIKNSVIDVYSGSQPANADDAATGTKLCRFTLASAALTSEVRANCRIAFTGGSLAAPDTVAVTIGGVSVANVTGLVGTAASLAAPAVANAINSSWTFPDYMAVAAGTTVGSIRYGEVANAANEVYVIAPKNAGATLNAQGVYLTVSTPANAAFAVNGGGANAANSSANAVAFANATNGGNGTSANGLGVVSTAALTMTYPAVDGKISKSGTWSANATANGTAAYFRLLATPNFDDGSTNISTVSSSNDTKLIMRIDGSVGTSGADMLISSTAITAAAAQTINQFDLTVA